MTAQPGGTPHMSDVRDTRYGEIFLIRSEEGQLIGAVYNTTGLNDCPLDKWRALNPQKLANQFGVVAVQLNGPRFWTMDQITVNAVGEILSFDGLEARWVAELPIPPDLSDPDRPGARYYRDMVIKRETEWHFAAGRPVYEMLTPDGKTYVMQAYSHIVDDSLTMQSLAAMGDRLQIPEGRQYRARTPDQELTLATVGGQAHILQDELQNTYMQLVTPDERWRGRLRGLSTAGPPACVFTRPPSHLARGLRLTREGPGSPHVLAGAKIREGGRRVKAGEATAQRRPHGRA
jgi:hypothetical protein